MEDPRKALGRSLGSGGMVVCLLIWRFYTTTRLNRRLSESLREEQTKERRIQRLNLELQKQLQYLQSSNKELEQFAYVASHDLQEPLRMVTSYLELLEKRYKGRLDSDADDFIHYAVDGAERMRNLIESLLDYSRILRKEKVKESVSLTETLGHTLQNLEQSIEKMKATITYGAMPTVSGDTVQLEQLFQNLISNALKYHGEKPLQIHISAELKPDEWVFSVQDNGIGIAPEYFERIFTIFQRLHRQDEYPGTGMGLAVCQKIVERHGGKIWADSLPDQGTTFYFTLPQRGNVEP